MISCIEIALKPELNDAHASALIKKADAYFGIHIQSARCIDIVTIEAYMSQADLVRVKDEILTNPVTQISGLRPLYMDFDWCIWIGFRPGVRDNPGATPMEAVTDLLGRTFGPKEGIYTSRRYCLKGESVTLEEVELLAKDCSPTLLSSSLDFFKGCMDPDIGAGVKPPG